MFFSMVADWLAWSRLEPAGKNPIVVVQTGTNPLCIPRTPTKTEQHGFARKNETTSVLPVVTVSHSPLLVSRGLFGTYRLTVT